MARHFSQKKYKLIAHRERFQNVEVDLLFQRRKRFFVIEVKSLRDQDFFPYLFGKGQKKRLKRALICLNSIFHCSVSLHLATVNQRDEIEIFEDALTFF